MAAVGEKAPSQSHTAITISPSSIAAEVAKDIAIVKTGLSANMPFITGAISRVFQLVTIWSLVWNQIVSPSKEDKSTLGKLIAFLYSFFVFTTIYVAFYKMIREYAFAMMLKKKNVLVTPSAAKNRSIAFFVCMNVSVGIALCVISIVATAIQPTTSLFQKSILITATFTSIASLCSTAISDGFSKDNIIGQADLMNRELLNGLSSLRTLEESHFEFYCGTAWILGFRLRKNQKKGDELFKGAKVFVNVSTADHHLDVIFNNGQKATYPMPKPIPNSGIFWIPNIISVYSGGDPEDIQVAKLMNYGFIIVPLLGLGLALFPIALTFTTVFCKPGQTTC